LTVFDVNVGKNGSQKLEDLVGVLSLATRSIHWTKGSEEREEKRGAGDQKGSRVVSSGRTEVGSGGAVTWEVRREKASK
jgi:hypothetical protein